MTQPTFNLKKLVLACSVALFGLVGCGGDSNNNTTPTTQPPIPNPTGSTIKQTASVVNEKANIAVYGNVDKAYFSETSLKSGNGVLLLDDVNQKVVGFGVELKPQSLNLNDFTKKYLDDFTTALKKENATVNVLVDKKSTNAQGEVSNITLDVNFANSTSIQKVRNTLLNYLNAASAVTTPVTVNAQDTKIRINLALWVANNAGYIWATTYTAPQAEAIKKVYGDISIASALSNVSVLTVAKKSDSFTQSATASNAVDILWTIDSSGSMAQEQKNLADGASQFFTSLNQAGIDYRLAVNTHDANNCKNLRTLKDGKTTFISPLTPAAQVEWAALSQPGTHDSGNEYGFYCNKNVGLTTFDRPTAKNISVFVSDEPENEIYYQYTPGYSTKAVDYATYEKDFLSTGTTYFAIVGTSKYLRKDFSMPMSQDPDWACSGQGGNAAGGAEFREIATKTGGSSASICADASSWNVMFDEIIKAASGLASSFNLTYTPIPSTVEVTVAGKKLNRDTTHQNGFDLVYSNKGASLVFYGAAMPKAQEKVEVTYSYLKK